MAMSTHYFAVFLVPFQNVYVLFLLLRRQARPGLWWRWGCSQVSVALLSLIGLAGIVSAESGYWWGLLDAWHGAPTLRDLVGLMFAFSLGTTAEGRLLYWVGLTVFAVCAAWAVVALLKGRSRLSVDEGLVFTLLYLVVPVGIIFALSQFRSFWVLRYLFLFLPPYCILVARGISRMPGWITRAVATLAVVLLSLWPIANIYRYEQKENWRGAVSYLSAQEQPTDVLLLLDEDIWLPFEHYYDGSMRCLGFSRAEYDRDLLAARVGAVLPYYGRIWLVLSHTENLILKDVLTSSPNTELLSERHFTGVEVDLFAVRPLRTEGS
jgi:hypothetical protein